MSYLLQQLVSHIINYQIVIVEDKAGLTEEPKIMVESLEELFKDKSFG